MQKVEVLDSKRRADRPWLETHQEKTLELEVRPSIFQDDKAASTEKRKK